jgi:hypothetical protein
MSTNGYPCPMTSTYREIPRIDIFVISYPPGKRRTELRLIVNPLELFLRKPDYLQHGIQNDGRFRNIDNFSKELTINKILDQDRL